MSTTQSRKAREIQERESRILETAWPLLIQHGYHGLSMDRIAEALQYSKGTIYNHFPCKEEIIIALAISTTEQRTAMFERAATFRGTSRQRLHAIGTAGELFARLFPDHFALEHMIRTASIWEKTSEKRRSVMRSCERRCMAVVAGVVRDAVAQGELQLEENMSPEDLVFGLWSLSLGAFSIIATRDQLLDLGITHPSDAYWTSISSMLDGFGWRPLSADYDFNGTRSRIVREVFPDEFQQISG